MHSNSLTGRQRKSSPCNGLHVELGCVTIIKFKVKVFSKTDIRNTSLKVILNNHLSYFLRKPNLVSHLMPTATAAASAATAIVSAARTTSIGSCLYGRVEVVAMVINSTTSIATVINDRVFSFRFWELKI